MHRLTMFFAAFALCLGGIHPAVAETGDASEIYGKFLDSWTEGGKEPINVAETAAALSAEDLAQLSDCASEGRKIRWAPVAQIDDLSAAIGQLSYVRLVDPGTWHPRDPGDLIATGQSIESAVESGIAHGLLTLSTIAFTESHDVAAFTYAFTCGELCGNGRPIVFKRTTDGWRESRKDCGGWMSYLEKGRQGGAFRRNWPPGSAQLIAKYDRD